MSVQIPCGEWLNGSRTYCEEGHLCETCSEITTLRKQLAELRAVITEKDEKIRKLGDAVLYERRHWQDLEDDE